MSAVTTSPSNGLVKQLDLSHRCPPGACDPGGFKSVLYGSIPAFELNAATKSVAELQQVMIEAVEVEDIQFLLLDLNQHDSLKRRRIVVEQLTNQLKALGCRLIPHHGGRPLLADRTGLPDRDAAIAECVCEWECQLLPQFSW